MASNLDALAAAARRELEQLRYPAANWVLPREGPDGKPMLDVLVVGGGMCGQTAAFALRREGVRNLRCVDQAPRGAEGPWRHVRAHGHPALAEAPHRPGPRRRHAHLPRVARGEVRRGALGDAAQDRARWSGRTTSSGCARRRRCRWRTASRWTKLELGRRVRQGPTERLERSFVEKSCLRWGAKEAARRAGRGSRRFDPEQRGKQRVPLGRRDRLRIAQEPAHRRCWAPALPRSTTPPMALEAGATEVVMFARRPHLPQVNKSKWTVLPRLPARLRVARRRAALALLHLHLQRAGAAALRERAALREARGLFDPLRGGLEGCRSSRMPP